MIRYMLPMNIVMNVLITRDINHNSNKLYGFSDVGESF